jgi:ElaB/YqjD/DUF883 family membrane-anchored ribosome-binding protein
MACSRNERRFRRVLGNRDMQTGKEPSIEALREESERSREALAATVGELRDRVGDTSTELKTLVSPSHIKQQVKDYVRQERETLVESIQRRARENPLQVAAIGAAVAYPALGLLRALPAPLWLIGAGLFLTSKRGRETVESAKTKIDAAVRQGSEQVSDLAANVQSDLQDRIAGAKYGVEEARDTVSSAVNSVGDKARRTFHDVRDAVTGATKDATDGVQANGDRAATVTAEKVGEIKDRVTGAATRSKVTVADFVNDNPLLVAGIGAAVGAFIAASLPPSEAENRLFGSGSEGLKAKAREAAAQGIEKAGDIAAEAAGAVAAAAAREGLDASGVKGALNKVADSVRKVADRGMDTAFGEAGHSPLSDQTQEQPASERNPS